MVGGEIKGNELSELRNEGSKGTDIISRVEGNMGDPVAIANYAAGEVSDPRINTRIGGGEVPRANT